MAAIAVLAIGCGSEPEPVSSFDTFVLQREREELCAGTPARADAFVEEVFAFLGESPPSHPFIDYHLIEGYYDPPLELEPPRGCDDPTASRDEDRGDWIWREYGVVASGLTRVWPDEGIYAPPTGIVLCGQPDCLGLTRATVGLANPPEEPWMRDNQYRVRVGLDPRLFPDGNGPPVEVVPF